LSPAWTSIPPTWFPELEPLLSHRRQLAGDVGGGQDQRADALTVLTALATARVSAMRPSLERHQAGNGASHNAPPMNPRPRNGITRRPSMRRERPAAAKRV
jgi:hypothetical protein